MNQRKQMENAQKTETMLDFSKNTIDDLIRQLQLVSDENR
jgi:hypothetical protein